MAALVGVFLVYQAQSFCLLATRPQIAQLRRLGLTAQEGALLILTDGLWMGCLGSVLGCWIGVGLSRFLIVMLTATLDDLYFSLEVQRVGVSGLSLLKGVVVGVGPPCWPFFPTPGRSIAIVPLALEWGPAWRRPPREPCSGSSGWVWAWIGGSSRVGQPPFLDGPSCGHDGSGRGIGVRYPHLASMANVALSRVLRGRVAVWVSLGLRQVQANITRTGVAVAALSLALAGVVSIETMVASFRITLNEWLELTLQSDIYVTLADHDAMRDGLFLPERFLQGYGRRGWRSMASQARKAL